MVFVRSGVDRHAGFTMMELLVVVLIIGTLLGFLIPNLHRSIVKARATTIVGDLHVVRVAVHSHLADLGTWPGDAQRGVIPGTLGPYLPEGFSFRADDYTLDYDNVPERRQSGSSFYILVTVFVTQSEVGQELDRILSSSAWLGGEPKFTVSKRGVMVR
ncbi:MAG: prepilin-type N-terminal cleavage/methylation domain-containing protein [Gemmatimonadota bacterium]